MMASVYDGIAASTLAMIKAKGARVTLTRVTVTIDPVTQDSTSISAQYQMYAVGLPVGLRGDDISTLHIGSLELRKVIEMHIAMRGVAVEPVPGDTITWGGYNWKVLHVPELYRPDGVTPIYAKAYLER